MEPRLATPPNVSMGGAIGVELLVREDGTAEPSFRYGHGERDGRMTAVKGKPFYLDMTFATEEVPGTSYMGLDFGTSTSSICYVNKSDIRAAAAEPSLAVGVNAVSPGWVSETLQTMGRKPSDGIPAAEVAKVIVRQFREGPTGSVAPAAKI